MTWVQQYIPLGGLWVSALLAALPILALFYMLAVRRTSGLRGGAMALIVGLLVAYFAWRMPMSMILRSAIYGVAFGLFPIGWIIITALFLYNITVETGQFEIIKDSIARISADRRLQALLIAFSFGAFLEGAAGFGAPVAISTAMLVGLGFEPLRAAGLSLLANTAPVAFAGFGIPLVTLAGVTGLNLQDLSSMVGRQLPFLSLILPAWLVVLVSGWRGLRGVWPAVLVSGLSFALVQWLTSNFLGPYLPDILSALISTVALVALLRFWRPVEVWRFPGEQGTAAGAKTHGGRQILRAWMPFLILIAVVLIWNLPWVKAALEVVTLKISVPGLHNVVIRMPPATSAETPYAAVFNFNWLSTAGTSLLFTAIISAALLGLGLRKTLRTFGRTLKQLWAPLATISSVLALAFAMNYSGMSTTLGLIFTKTGWAFPFFAPLLGWLGVFLTGSDTSSNALFGKLQAVAAQQVGISPTLAAAANTSGGVTGKMISPQSIAVGSVSAGLAGQEGKLFRYTIKHSLALAILLGVLTLLQAYVVPWMVP